MDYFRYSLLLLLPLFSVCCGQVVKDLMASISQVDGTGSCGIALIDNVTCLAPDGHVVSITEENRIPAFTVCYLKDASGHDDSFICLANGVKDADSHALQKATRQKRFLSSFLSGLLSPITAVVNLASSIICIFVCKNDQPPPYQPPKLLCAAPTAAQPVIAQKGEESAVVTWNPPSATDMHGNKVRIQQQPSDYHSGKRFSEGRYSIAFLAVDSASAAATCVMEFEVKVIHCGRSQWPENGLLSCDGYTYGKTCTVSCLTGYQLKSGMSAIITCETYGGWSRNPPNCIPKPCKPLPNIQNGRIDCPDNKAVYGNTCTIRCDNGYRLTGPYFVSCDEKGDWGSTGICKDSVPPVFNMKTCPDNLVVNIDSANNTALVKWDIPEGNDNSRQQPKITEANGYRPNTRFAAGSYLLRYRIEDADGNVGQSCVFKLRVQTISCDPPNLSVEGASHMVYTCPERYRFGAECKLSCKSGYPLGGTDKIQCANIDEGANPPKLDWSWPKDALGPYCKETVCADLRTPTNGATACDLWTHGRQCQIQCQKDYDFAYQFPDVYVCGTNTGLWKPMELVPDCTRKITPHQAHLMSDVYYYTGQCNSSKTNLHQIQTNFIKALNSSAFNAVCLGEPFCKAEFVNVSCGPITTRRRRDISQHHLHIRSADPFAYIVQFELILALDASAVQSDFAVQAGKLQKMAGIIQTEMDSGNFDIHLSDLHTEYDSFGPGVPSFRCPEGTKTRMTTQSCAGCPIGMFMSEEKSNCESCPLGTFQDTINSVTCKSCPVGTNTTSNGSDSVHQCKAICSTGSYSANGLAPCIKCPATHYQPSKGQTYCLPCGGLRRTLDVGATSEVECKAYDILISHGKGTAIRNVTSAGNSLTITTWMFLRNIPGTVSLFGLESNSKSIYVTLQKSGEVVLNLNSTLLSTGVRLEKTTWIHLAVVLNHASQMLKIYKNGGLIYESTKKILPVENVFKSGGNFIINADVQVSSFYLLETSLSSSDIQQYATSCLHNTSVSLINQDDIELQTDARLVIPSKCDDIDECSANPCGSHECVNKLGGFECICTGGFTGSLCDIPPDFCNAESCLNGATCITGQSNYTCSCPRGFHGTHCEIQAKNGKWSEWTDWDLCSKTCAGGITMRRRRCDSPPPDPEGQPCNGADTETKSCNPEKCPACSRVRRSYGLLIHCNDTEFSKRCTLSCRPGLYFASPPLMVYECGRATGYKWNHQTSDNPSARLPICSNVKPPEKISVGFEGEYSLDPCDKTATSSLIAAFETKLQTTTCLQSDSCVHTISTTSCNSRRRKRSQSGSTTVSIELSLAVDNKNLGTTLESLLVNKTAHSSLLKLLTNVKDLEKTAQEIYNNSVKFLQVTVSGKPLTPVHTMPLPLTTVLCPPGSVKLDIFCAVVPQGTYLSGTSVIPCPRNEYQDLAGQTKCKQCPAFTTTIGIGSTAVSDCIAGLHPTESGGHNRKEKEGGKGTKDSHYGIHVAIGVSVSVALVVCIVVVVILAYKYLQKRNHRVNDSRIIL